MTTPTTQITIDAKGFATAVTQVMVGRGESVFQPPIMPNFVRTDVKSVCAGNVNVWTFTDKEMVRRWP